MNKQQNNTTQKERPLPLASVFSVEGLTLTRSEKSLFSAAQPFGFILFGRNVDNPTQVKKLTDELRETVGWDCPIMIDQEGGRISRLKPPHWHAHPPARSYGERIEANDEAGRLRLSQDMRDLALMLSKLGIDVDCAPVMDVSFPETHDIIGDRAFSSDPEIIAQAADVVCEAFLSVGVQPIIKHIPGHGRAKSDSHLELPIVNTPIDELRAYDFKAFSRICERPYAKSLWAMTAFITYTAIDSELPTNFSEKLIRDVIRGEMNFQGLLFTDDLDMKALDKYGSIPERGRLSLQAGCDVTLYCWADLKIMEQLAAELPPLSAQAWERWQNSIEASWAA
jgi:beta-N-acetylhexosaminidase